MTIGIIVDGEIEVYHEEAEYDGYASVVISEGFRAAGYGSLVLAPVTPFWSADTDNPGGEWFIDFNGSNPPMIKVNLVDKLGNTNPTALRQDMISGLKLNAVTGGTYIITPQGMVLESQETPEELAALMAPSAPTPSELAALVLAGALSADEARVALGYDAAGELSAQTPSIEGLVNAGVITVDEARNRLNMGSMPSL